MPLWGIEWLFHSRYEISLVRKYRSLGNFHVKKYSCVRCSCQKISVLYANLTRVQLRNTVHMLKIFRAFNFRTLWRVQKFFDNKNFPNYGKCCTHLGCDVCLVRQRVKYPLGVRSVPCKAVSELSIQCMGYICLVRQRVSFPLNVWGTPCEAMSVANAWS